MLNHWRSAPIRRLHHPVEDSILWGFLGGALWGLLALFVGAPFLAIISLALPLCLLAQWAAKPRTASDTINPYDRRWLGSAFKNSVLHVVLIIETRPDIQNIRNLISTKVLPSYPCLLKIPNGNYWFPDLKFNIERHVFDVTVNLPSENCVQEYLRQLLSEGLRNDKPPWELQLLNKHAILRVHQCIADGHQLLRVLCRALAEYHINPMPFTSTTFLFQLFNACILGPLSLIFWALFSVHDCNIFTKKDSWTGEKSIAWSSTIPISQVTHIKAVTRSTANCVILSALAGALRCLLQGCGVAQPPNVHVVLPASIGRWTAPVSMALPVGVEGAIPRLWATRHSLRVLRHSPRPAILYLAAVALLTTSTCLARNFLTSLTGKASLQFSSMKGPAGIIKVDGTPVLGVFPLLPAPSSLGLSVTAFIYSDRVFIAVVSDSSLDPTANLLLHHLKCQVDQIYKLLLHRRVPGESRAHLLLRRVGLDVRDSPTRELRLRLSTVQEEVTHQLTAGFESERIQTLKMEFSHLLCELRRRKSQVGDDPSALEDDEMEGAMWRPQQRRALSCTVLRRPSRMNTLPARPASYVDPQPNTSALCNRSNRPLSCSDSDMYFSSPYTSFSNANFSPSPRHVACLDCNSHEYSPETYITIENEVLESDSPSMSGITRNNHRGVLDSGTLLSDCGTVNEQTDENDVICADRSFKCISPLNGNNRVIGCLESPCEYKTSITIPDKGKCSSDILLSDNNTCMGTMNDFSMHMVDLYSNTLAPYDLNNINPTSKYSIIDILNNSSDDSDSQVEVVSNSHTTLGHIVYEVQSSDVEPHINTSMQQACSSINDSSSVELVPLNSSPVDLSTTSSQLSSKIVVTNINDGNNPMQFQDSMQ